MTFQDAIKLHHAGRLEEAATAYQGLLARDPTHLDALIHLGVLRLSQGAAPAAETLLRRAVAAAPQSAIAQSAVALANLGSALQAQARHGEAADQLRRALALDPGMTDARFALAACLQAEQRIDDAVDAYHTLLQYAPDHPEGHFGLATLLVGIGRRGEAETQYRAALAADPDFAEASLGLGRLLARGASLPEAVACFRQALDVDPDYLEARLALADALTMLRQHTEARAAYRAVLAAEPDNVAALNGIGTILGQERKDAEAAAHYRAILARHPSDTDAMGGLATALKNLGEPAEALALIGRILAIQPDHAAALGLRGAVLAETGAIPEAQAAFRRALSLAPDRTDLAYHLTEIARVRRDDEVIARLEDMLSRIGTYLPEEQCQLLFALGKAYDDIGERDRSFDLLLRGNALKRQHITYREDAALRMMTRIAQVFDAHLLASRLGWGDPATEPVFIIGMPRSGTTLVEQVLASHHAVFGAGERLELGEVVRAMTMQRLGSAPFPEVVPLLAQVDLTKLGRDYVTALRRLAPRALRIVDKMPVNFMYAGLIRMILPNARIIHTRRDPVDTCLSIFSKLFSGDQPFSYDLAELGRYHAGYQRLMAHWRAILPPDVMIDVDYETMVQDFEPQARRIVAHCGLDWDPACLEFHRTERSVRTASMTQVRQPIYRSSMGRWRPKPALLEPLQTALATGIG
ncbi:tetratricopeptide repeat-containing sulfotransferase family protein [Rhodopila sp.]|jgi:tetratricopeptide (TPR) repeat protein|uniref:tetratricopeptide repeat-containing sulfotransferase family protein n=1 Tax=Rhodopila sp. TaxID=2480087 RepID=UPI002CB66DB3|nr:sulfotransferase [Rhodopila sp.]HVZ06401.1 sulfotransferase [Rhodopila sp.]